MEISLESAIGSFPRGGDNAGEPVSEAGTLSFRNFLVCTVVHNVQHAAEENRDTRLSGLSHMARVFL